MTSDMVQYTVNDVRQLLPVADKLTADLKQHPTRLVKHASAEFSRNVPNAKNSKVGPTNQLRMVEQVRSRPTFMAASASRLIWVR